VTEIFHRPLTDPERSLLLDLATRTIADEFPGPCTYDEASDVLAHLVALGQVEISGDGERAQVRANGTLLVDTTRNFLAFHAEFPGHDPMADARRD
jgi:hypothetical protein